MNLLRQIMAPFRREVVAQFNSLSPPNGKRIPLKSSRLEPLNHKAKRDWIRTTRNRIRRRMQSLPLLPGGEGRDEGERYNQL